MTMWQQIFVGLVTTIVGGVAVGLILNDHQTADRQSRSGATAPAEQVAGQPTEPLGLPTAETSWEQDLGVDCAPDPTLDDHPATRDIKIITDRADCEIYKFLQEMQGK
jgi:hypothetical protein